MQFLELISSNEWHLSELQVIYHQVNIFLVFGSPFFNRICKQILPNVSIVALKINAGGIGSSGLTRIIGANSVPGANQTLNLPTAMSSPAPPSLTAMHNPLKRKREEDDDYDKV